MTAPALDSRVLERLRQLNQPGEPDIVREVLMVFLDDAPRRLAAMADALRQNDAVSLQRAAHTLKGAAANIGAVALESRCRELEESGKAALLDGASPIVRGIESEFGRVKAEIDERLARA